MTGQNSDGNILIPALEAALAHWEEWKREKTFFASSAPGRVLGPLAAAIARRDVYKPVAGHSLFSGYCGVVCRRRHSLCRCCISRSPEFEHCRRLTVSNLIALSVGFAILGTSDLRRSG